MARIFLGVSALVWFGYGAYCFMQPSYLGDAAGVTAASPTGTIELRAMYGGLQMAIGALAAAGVLRFSLERPAIIALGFLCVGLGSTRLIAALGAADSSVYTVGAVMFELGCAAIAARILAGGAVA